MILCDTNVFIHAFNGNEATIAQMEVIGLTKIGLSAITLMELYQGTGNKSELAQMKKKLRFYDIVQVDRHISTMSIELIENFKLSHSLQIPDAIIGATAIVYNIPLYTYNIKDFNFMPNINIHTV
ncbi:MAG: type II toxin-antitoxin system VapC family toxin [Methylococcales bacterium]|nr:type II toxin-antitoxin system VapC family toxin [Methylococcales bacterium]MDD5632406.1 type II toxin-antitoxin system VapC family toxin [Methylococcales bacterium]